MSARSRRSARSPPPPSAATARSPPLRRGFATCIPCRWHSRPEPSSSRSPPPQGRGAAPFARPARSSASGEAWGCYGLGSLANAVLPARLGEAVRIGLFASRLARLDRRWLSGGACLAVAGARGAVYALTCAGAAAAGLLPGWTLAAPLVAAVTLATFIGVVRTRARGRAAGLGLAAALSPAAVATLLGWVSVAAASRLAGAVGVLEALDVPRPFAPALVGLAALAVGSTVPLAPGGAGVAGVGMVLALEQLGVAPPSAVAAAVAFHALETLASVVFGSSGWVALRTATRPKKNQKVQKLRDLHGEIVTILYACDFRRLRRKYGRDLTS